MLARLWDKRLKEFETAANQIGNQKMKALIMELRYAVPKAVKTAVLKEYIKRCNDKYIIAFLQWRYRYPPKGLDDPEKEHLYKRETMGHSMRILSEKLLKTIDISRQPKAKTKKKAFVDPKDDKDFQQVLGDGDEEIEKN